MADDNVTKIETTRTMLTKAQVRKIFRDGEGKPIFSHYMLDTLIREGVIPHVRLHNRKIMFCKETLEEWLRQQELKSMIQPVETNRFGLRKL